MTSPPVTNDHSHPGPSTRSAQEIRDWLINKLSTARHIEPADIRDDQPLSEMGLDSMQALVLIGELEQWLGCRFTDNPLLVYPTIDVLAAYLSGQLARGNQLIDPARR